MLLCANRVEQDPIKLLLRYIHVWPTGKTQEYQLCEHLNAIVDAKSRYLSKESTVFQLSAFVSICTLLGMHRLPVITDYLPARTTVATCQHDKSYRREGSSVKLILEQVAQISKGSNRCESIQSGKCFSLTTGLLTQSYTTLSQLRSCRRGRIFHMESLAR